MQEDIGMRKDMVLKNVIKVIAFDADDTLWENQPYFDEVEEKLCSILSEYGGSGHIREELFRTEMRNMDELGYGTYIPFRSTWQHEQADEYVHPRLFRLERLSELPAALQLLAHAIPLT